ncbi:MAG TPA: DUF4097 family beta strand repeat-containing protein [Blastocatellia bacterium]|nr:DUF4097 family beta strand repeat-containing protein [Blastocatellia bacterium]
MKRVIVALLILGGSIILIGVNFGPFLQAKGFRPRAREKAEERITQSFEVAPGGLLSVDIDGGSIEIRPSDSPKVYVEMYRRIEAGSSEAARELLERNPVRISQSGNNVYIEAQGPNTNGRSRKNVELKVSVPRNFNVDLKTSGGKIGVEGLDGTVRAKTSGGNLSFSSIRGPVRGETSGGPIAARDIDGEVVVKTSGGGIEVINITNDVVAHTSGGSITARRIEGKLDAKTSGGSLNFEEVSGEIDGRSSGGSVTARFSKPIDANCRLETSGGTVNVYLPENSQFDLDAQAGSGQIMTEFPVSITFQGKLEKSTLKGQVNGGGAVLYCRTSGSNINLKKNPAAVSMLIHGLQKQACSN